MHKKCITQFHSQVKELIQGSLYECVRRCTTRPRPGFKLARSSLTGSCDSLMGKRKFGYEYGLSERHSHVGIVVCVAIADVRGEG
jgi:hypothetical protein